MKKIIFVLAVLTTFLSFSQKKDKALVASNDLIYKANEVVNDDFVSAEMEYRKAISQKPSYAIGAYNLGNAYYNNGKFNEALLRHQEAIRTATTKAEKHKAYHNIGNTLMQEKKCKEAVEAYKSALRNNPNDDETRYNLGLAKECSKNQGGGGGGEDEDKEDEQDQNQQEQQQSQDQNQDQKENNEQNDNEKEEGEDNKKEGEEQEDEEGKPKDENKEMEQGDQKKDEKRPKPQQGQLSPQQIKNLLEAMNDQEQKVQEKINAQKAKGAKVQTDKDW